MRHEFESFSSLVQRCRTCRAGAERRRLVATWTRVLHPVPHPFASRLSPPFFPTVLGRLSEADGRRAVDAHLRDEDRLVVVGCRSETRPARLT
ncbi:hypothetical protein ACFPRL_23245 [Pseudoclavibacter helvolus]